MYCQLLCGLVQRDEVVSVGATFPSVLLQIVQFLENYWKELSSDIRSGNVSDWITDLSCRDSLSTILGEPNAELADLIEYECSGQKSWQGIITRLWPKTKCIETIVTGTMSQYIPALDYYSNKVPLVSKVYASSEAFFGINVNPLSKPQDISFTFLPNMSYFEFIEVDDDGGTTGEIVDLVNVKLGSYYEPLLTNFSGLHRCKVGDVLQVTGFYNNTPQLRFVRRKNTVLCVYEEPTTEEDILKALASATVVLESSDLIMTGFTCYGDISVVPGHYVFYLELIAKVNDGTNVLQLDNKVLVEYCCAMEESLSSLYRKLRVKDGPIGPLEVRIVQQGTFDSLMEFFVSRGASITQYKTPMCINSAEALKVLEDKVLARFFSDRSPLL
ncbi:Auxin-responsive GH3 family protein [Raphanus sativus]|nr:Auxin-responsive GH3 family protein [Raphanus sativus]